MARGPARGLLGVKEPVEVRPRELVMVAPGGTAMGLVRWPGRVPPGDTAMGLARWLFMGVARRLVNWPFCDIGTGPDSSELIGPARGLTREPAVGLICGLFSTSARGVRAMTPTSSRTGSFAAAGDGGRKTPGGHRESTETPGGAPSRIKKEAVKKEERKKRKRKEESQRLPCPGRTWPRNLSASDQLAGLT
jgi:hypothetical protein